MNSFVIFHSKILSFCAFHILTNNLKQELINEVNFFVSTFFFQLWYNGEFNTIHYFIREIIKIQILGIHAIKIQSLVISKSNMIIHLMDFFFRCNVFFDLQNLHSTRIRTPIDDIGLYKYSLIKITVNFIDHPPSDSIMTPRHNQADQLKKISHFCPGSLMTLTYRETIRGENDPKSIV